MRRLLNLYFRLLQILMTAMLALLLVPVTMQIVARYSDIIPRYIWTEEISRFAFVWIVILGSIVALRQNGHFIVDVLPQVSPRTQTIMTWINLVVMMIAGIVFTYGGYTFAQFGALQRSELAGLPMLAIFIAWPFLGVNWLIFTAEHIYDFATGTEELGDGSV